MLFKHGHRLLKYFGCTYQTVYFLNVFRKYIFFILKARKPENKGKCVVLRYCCYAICSDVHCTCIVMCLYDHYFSEGQMGHSAGKCGFLLGRFVTFIVFHDSFSHTVAPYKGAQDLIFMWWINYNQDLILSL